MREDERRGKERRKEYRRGEKRREVEPPPPNLLIGLWPVLTVYLHIILIPRARGTGSLFGQGPPGTPVTAGAGALGTHNLIPGPGEQVPKYKKN